MREPALHDYLDARATPVPAYLVELERATHLRSLKPQMLTGVMQGRFLSWLVGWLRPLAGQQPFRVLEIGTYTGYGALCLAERLRPGDEVVTIEVNDELEPLIREYVGRAGFDGSRANQPQIKLLLGDANALLPTLPGPWHLVYLDGRKEDYPAQFAEVAARLAPGAHVLLDNVLWDAQVLATDKLRPTARLLRDFTLALAQNPRWETLLLPMSDGLLLVREVRRER